MKKTMLTFLAGFTLLVTACGMPAAGSGSSDARSDVITYEQMLEVNANNAYDAVQRLQPGWLSGRGPGVVPNVYVNGTRVGDVEYLRNLQVQDVARMRFYSSSEAGGRFGMNNEGGVIEVTSR